MSVRAPRVSVDTTRDVIVTGTSTDDVSGTNVTIRNEDDTESVFIGGENVEASGANKGFEVYAGDPFSFPLQNGEKVFGITASGTVEVSTFQTGV